MKFTVELDEKEIREIIAKDLTARFSGVTFRGEMLPIEVKSKQNYRSEWEHAKIRIKVDVYPIEAGDF